MNNAARARPAATGVVLVTLASGQFLMTLDSSVMNVSIATVAIETFITELSSVIRNWPAANVSSTSFEPPPAADERATVRAAGRGPQVPSP